MLLTEELFSLWRGYTGDLSAYIDDHELKLKVLITPEEQAEGFMNKPEPADDSFGLYFKYSGNPRTLGFWMKNVPYNLELLAFDNNMILFEIIPLKANDHRTRIISRPCSHVLELKSGYSARNNLKIGVSKLILP